MVGVVEVLLGLEGEELMKTGDDGAITSWI